MKFKKIISLSTAMIMCVSMTGCSVKDKLRSWLLEDEGKEQQQQVQTNPVQPQPQEQQETQPTDPTLKAAYDFIKENTDRWYKEAGIFENYSITTEDNCVVFELTFSDEEFVYSYENNNNIFKEYAQTYLINTYNLKKALEEGGANNISVKFRLKSSTRIYMVVTDGRYVTVDTGNEDVDNAVIEFVKNFDPSSASAQQQNPTNNTEKTTEL